ncbi:MULTISPECIES: dienelactone hydrolase family protein [Pseudomonas]|uniref:dienelactone hydrolase family protein n=1 Tax=Pseudomonas TaxID=286 RepID=UPI0013A7A54B|nr:dienelactone hydrolase family protein [Pseudomonas sp. OIL-1]QIB52587.1 dienelactone hydrolase family protein [Pseudomonas sp. OIL-1]
MRKTLSTLLMATAGLAQAEMVSKPVSYDIDGEPYEGLLVYDDATSEPRPGLLMVPNWMGVTENSAKKAFRAGGSDYVVFVADMYGKDKQPANAEEAGKLAGALRKDRDLMRKRVNTALNVFKSQSEKVGLDTGRIGAIGFCFGGGAVLELARSGTDIGGVVSFHGNLDTPNPKDAESIKTPVLVLHGDEDPSVPQEQVEAFKQEMRAADVDWQLVIYGGAVHSFTNPAANVPGKNEYHPVVAERAFTAMRQFFSETLED